MTNRSAARIKEERSIVIDAKRDWVFSSEEEVVHFFHPLIEQLRDEFAGLHQDDDFDLEKFGAPDVYLESTMIQPDEVWEDTESVPGTSIHVFMKSFDKKLKKKTEKSIEKNGADPKAEKFWYIVLVYLSDGRPTFVFTHFPTRIEEMVSTYRRSKLVHGPGAEDVEFIDALAAGDAHATQLFDALMRVRSDGDIPTDQFSNYHAYRALTIDDPDEIWRSEDGHELPLVRFIKEFSQEDQPTFHYIVVTAEEEDSHSHYVLFSFPTSDVESLDRYRQGEKLNPEEFVREESH